MKIAHTRAMITAALEGDLRDVPTRVDPVFGLAVPESCPNVPKEVLDPRSTWADGARYDAQATRLAAMFRENFRQFASEVPREIAAAGPLA